MDKAMIDRGMAVRREVLGDAYVDRALAEADDFSMPFQELAMGCGWGEVWTREGLTRQTRSLLTIAMTTALNRPHEIRLHVRGALRNGCTTDEIREVLLHAAIYCGMPAALDAFRHAREAIEAFETDPEGAG